MADSLKVFSLTKESISFVFSNAGILKDHLKIIFPAILLVSLIEKIGQMYELKWIVFVTLVPMMYLYACFALGWHRSSLTAPSSSHMVNPFNMRKEDMKFVYVYFGLAFVPFVVAIILGALFGLATTSGNTGLIALAGVLLVSGSIFLFIQLLRVSFLLPAQSVGVSLTLSDARKASRGLIWKLLSAGAIVSFLFLICMFIYGLIVGLTVGVMSKGAEPDKIMTGAVGFIFEIPILIAAMFVTAITVTMLSKAYQWGMQNNS
jgi:hypothetical protein